MSDGLNHMGNKPQVTRVQTNLSAFCDLALGTRFRYPFKIKVWVKIDHDTIAEWDDKMKDCGWTGQILASFSDDTEGIDVFSPVEVL